MTTSFEQVPTARYLPPDRVTRTLVNPVVRGLMRIGVSVRGSRTLEVRGRVSGRWRRVPVNPLTVGGERYLVAPRGRTEWVRNLEVAGTGRVRLGRRAETVRAVAVADDDKPPILRAYLSTWAREVGVFFDGLPGGSPDADLLAAAPRYPVFRLTAA